MQPALRPLGVVALAALAACAPKRVDERPITVARQGERVAGPEAVVAATRASSDSAQRSATSRRDSLTAAALARCSGSICAAIARGEVALGMTEADVMAATRTTSDAWSVRRAGDATVMVPRRLDDAPRDAVGSVVLLQLAGGKVTAYSYREPSGIRTVTTPAEATAEGRSRAIAQSLVAEGDRLAAAGNLQAALDRYDRASVLLPNDPTLEYRLATVLDRQLRPIEALMRYQRFLHQMELERIKALGDAYAKQAEAIARARERVIILEKQQRR